MQSVCKIMRETQGILMDKKASFPDRLIESEEEN